MVSTFTTVALPACISILNGLPSNDEVAKADPSAMIMGEMNLNGHAFKYKVAAGAKGGVMHGAGGKTIKFTISGGMGHMKFMGHSINFPLHRGSAEPAKEDAPAPAPAAPETKVEVPAPAADEAAPAPEAEETPEEDEEEAEEAPEEDEEDDEEPEEDEEEDEEEPEEDEEEDEEPEEDEEEDEEPEEDE